MHKVGILLISLFLLIGCSQVDKPEKSQDHVAFEINGQHNEYDIVSSATSGNVDGEGYQGEEKEKRMKWSGRPSEGVIQGDYYYDFLEFDGGYLATVFIVKNRETEEIIAIEFDERSPDHYYDSSWANQTKRTSGYANWQMQNERTDKSLVTVVNAMTFLEYQVLKKNSVDGEFMTPKGSSNSGYHGYIPLLRKIGNKINKESQKHYVAVTRDLGQGIFARLQVVYNKGDHKILDLHYDEYFADEKNLIKEEVLKEYYRQSKYQSPLYQQQLGDKFKDLVDQYRREVIEKQNLMVSSSKELGSHFDELIAEVISAY